jgi:DNA-directed RNA polymerase specialized sigma24 family protein
MSGGSNDFTLLLQRAQQRLPGAAEEITKTFGPRLLRVIRRRLQGLNHLRRLLDPEDLCQDVWVRFFARSLHKNNFAAPAALTAFLLKVGRSSVGAMERHYLRRRKRDMRRDEPRDAPAGLRPGGECVSPAPGPDRVAEGRDEWEQLLASQPAENRPALVLLGEGWTVAAAAAELRLSEKAVRRIRAHAARLNRPLPVGANQSRDQDEGRAPHRQPPRRPGEHCVARDDWVVRDVQGELYPCKPDIFRATYESVE